MTTPSFLHLAALLLLGVASSFAATSTDDAAISSVLAADRARGAALLSADASAMAKILAADFRYTHSNNKQETKATHIDSFVQGMRYTRFETSSLRGHVITPDVVVVNGIIDQTKGKEGKETNNHLLFQAVWRKNASGDWQLTSLQTAAPPPPPTSAPATR